VKREERRFLKDPDEFVVWTTRLGTWAQTHRTTLIAAGAVVALAIGAAGLLGWRSARQTEAASEAFGAARAKFVARDYGPAALDFEAVAREYPSTSFGRLAVLYRGHCLLRSGDAAGAATAYQDFLARVDGDPYLRQLALTNLSHAQEQSGAAEDARASASKAGDLQGPYRVEALLIYARLSEAAGDAPAAQGAYRKILDDNPDAETKSFVQRRLPAQTEAGAPAG
jgi:predicted negative regulator of RcsB-dependent stress response